MNKSRLGTENHEMMQRLKYANTTPLWDSAGVIKPRKVDGFDTTAIAVFERHSARAVALVYAGFGDGVAIARLIAAAPAMLDMFIELTKPEYGELANAKAHEAIAYTQKAPAPTKFDPDPPRQCRICGEALPDHSLACTLDC